MFFNALLIKGLGKIWCYEVNSGKSPKSACKADILQFKSGSRLHSKFKGLENFRDPFFYAHSPPPIPSNTLLGNVRERA